MFYQEDWLMRQIELLVRFVAGVVFDKKTLAYEIKEESTLFQADDLYQRVMQLLQEGNICKAENLLYEEFRADDQTYLAVVVEFYQRLNQLSNDELKESNFSREEILEGLNGILHKANIVITG